jgi:gamma-D-glutamyl-L-lysine dipeptidyl-peptidase
MKSRVNINVADIRKEASQLTERINQALFNELAEILETGNEMCRVRLSDGYEGWIGRQFLSPHNGFDNDGPFMVKAVLSNAFESKDRSSHRVTYIPYGCWLYGKISDGWLEAKSERYGRIFLSESDYIDKNNLLLPHEGIPDILAQEAEKFLGVPYLWGGRSFFGLDCSGFIGLIMARFGITLPRDTKDQINAGEKIDKDQIHPGDLLFFPRHIGLAISNTLYIHSSRSNGGVAYNSLDPRSAIYSESHDKSFIEARRVLV